MLSTLPLIINKSTGIKFGKSEDGAVWLDPSKTTPTEFYQFWINVDDEGVADYLKVYTELDKPEIDRIISEHEANRQKRIAQHRLAKEVTQIVHGAEATSFAEAVTHYLTGEKPVGDASDAELAEIRKQVKSVKTTPEGSIIDSLAETLAASKSEARRLLEGSAISVNGTKVTRENFEPADFTNGRLLLRKGKKFKDSALVELA